MFLCFQMHYQDDFVYYIIVFLAGDDNQYFKINNFTGTIYVNSTIDRDEGIDYFELIVQVIVFLSSVFYDLDNCKR